MAKQKSGPRRKEAGFNVHRRASLATYASLGTAILFWGFNWPVVKLGVAHMPPIWFAAMRGIIGFAVLSLILLALGRFYWPRKQDLPIIFTAGSLFLGLTSAFVFIGIQFVDAGRSAILSHTSSIWAVPLAIIILRERIGPLRITALILGLSGVAVFMNPLSIDWSNWDVIKGHLFLLGSALCAGIAIVHTRFHNWARPPLETMPWQILLGTSILLILSLSLEDISRTEWDSFEMQWTLVYNGVFATAVCFTLQTMAARDLPASTTSLALLATPVLGLASSVVFLGEPLTVSLILGFVLVLAGVTFVSLSDAKRAREARRMVEEPEPHPVAMD